MKRKPVTCEYLRATAAIRSTFRQFPSSQFDWIHSIEFIFPALIHIKHGTNFNTLTGTTYIYTDLTKQAQQKGTNTLNSI